jgi:hypothetical protein
VIFDTFLRFKFELGWIGRAPDALQSAPLDPPVSGVAPTDRNLTGYDQQHLVTYLRLLDADAEAVELPVR